MNIRFWGTRGSIPVPGKSAAKYGGNTPCVELRSADNLFILDGGSGMRELGNKLIQENTVKDIHILISHYHWDHIQGIPFFKPLYNKNYNLVFYGLSTSHYSLEKLLSSQMAPEHFPISIEEVSASVQFRNIYPDDNLEFGELKITTYQANHPSVTLVYKFEKGNKSFIYMTDNELKFEQNKNSVEYKNLVEFCRGCDYLIHDAMFDEESEQNSRGWGHSSNISLAEFAIHCNTKNIVLFHYNPDYSDQKINTLLQETKKYFKSRKSLINCIASKEGLEIKL
jgi:phosphoribosyl 1,2-cyclic phosphodiesterase